MMQSRKCYCKIMYFKEEYSMFDSNGSKLCLFAAGVVVGAGAYALIQNGTAKKAAVAVMSKGLELQEKVAEMAARAKESAEDIVAEATAAQTPVNG